MQNIWNSITVFTHFHLFLVCLIRLNEEAVCNYSNIASLRSVAGVERVGELGLGPHCAAAEWTAEVNPGKFQHRAFCCPTMGGVFKTFYLTWAKSVPQPLLTLWGVEMSIGVNDRKSFLVLFIFLRSGGVREETFPVGQQPTPFPLQDLVC